MTERVLRLPAPDRVLSGRTGLGRSHWIAVADQLLDALVPWFSPLGARVDLPGRTSISGTRCDGLEGFARSFMLAAFRIAATDGCEPLVERYARGLAAGADPDSPEAWPRLAPRSQQMVEAAAIAVALHESRARLWDRLDDRTRQHVAGWLGGFIGSTTWDNNWRLFQVVGEQFLASIGAEFSQDDIDAGLDRIEDWYVGDGWYRDGDGQHYDHYIGWAMHLYPGLWARMAAATDGTSYDGRLEAYRDRLRRFLADAVHLVGADGAPMHQGRSLCYRMAAAAPFWAGALLDASPLAPGLTRRACSGILRHFLEHGVPDERGLLTLGWHHRFLPATQAYSGPGSPYWAGKGFLGLLLPADHPVWTAPEEQLPVESGDRVRAMPAPGFLVHSTRHDGLVRLLNHGSDHGPLGLPDSPGPEPAADPHYDRLAYSTRTGPEVSGRAGPDRVDNHVALLGPDGTTSHRGRIRRIAVEPAYAASWHRAWLGDVGPWRIESASVVHGAWEIRCTLVDGPAAVPLRHGGYAVAAQRPAEVTTGSVPWAAAERTDGLTSAIVGLHGYDEAGIRRDTGTNAFGPHSATPYLLGRTGDGPRVYVAAVVLSGDTVWPDAIAESVTVEVRDLRVELALADGTTAAVSLGAAETSAAGGPDGRPHQG